MSSSLDNKPIKVLIDSGSSVSLLVEQLHYSLSLVLPLETIPFLISGSDDKLLIALDKTFLSIAINDNTLWVQLVVTRNILLTVVLQIVFLQTHGGIISYPTNQLYIANPSPKPVNSPINTGHIHNTNTTCAHT